MAKDLRNQAEFYLQQGKCAEAEPLYKRALAIYAKVLRPDHPQVTEVAENLAKTVRKLGRKQEVKVYEEQAA